MQYLLMLYVNEDGWQADQGPAGTRHGRLCRLYRGAQEGGRVQGRRPPSPDDRATTVRIANGKPQVLDGPYADSKEQLGGYFLIEVPDLDAAISWAARCPARDHGVVEVRPVWDMRRMSA